MARHRLSPSRVPFLARSRRPALLGGVLGGGAALVIGIVVCAVLATTSVGVHFTFVDKAEAAVIGATHDQPALTRDLATAGSAAPTPTPTPSTTAKARAQAAQAVAQAVADSPSAAPTAPAVTAADPQPTVEPTSSATASAASVPPAAPSPGATASAAPVQRPTPQPSNPPSNDECVLFFLCF